MFAHAVASAPWRRRPTVLRTSSRCSGGRHAGSVRRCVASSQGTDLPVREVNIWDDPDAAAIVRSFARGNETVPTVVVGALDSDRAVGLVNPSGAEVLAAVAEHAPHLLG